MPKVTPMIHVPDVRATVDWYRDIGFTVHRTYGNGRGGLSFGIVSFGSTQVMFNQGGQPSTSKRREVDLYVYADDVDEIYHRLKDRVEIVQEPEDAFHGMREFIIRDCNRFWITFGQPTAYELLMNGVQEGNVDTVRAALNIPIVRGGLKPEMLSAALGDASAGEHQNATIVEMLRQAGALRPLEIDAQTLQSYVGTYHSDEGFEVNVTVENGRLVGTPAGDPPMSLIAIDRTTFKPIAFEAGTISFKVESGKTTGCVLRMASHAVELKRVE